MSTNTGGASPRVLSLQNSGNNPQSALPDSDLQLPAGALDCHVHVIDPLRYPCPLTPGYLPPPPARTDSTALDSVLQQHGVAGALLVQASCYGTDNSVMLDMLHSKCSARAAVAGIEPDISGATLEALAAGGIIGLRLNVINHGTQALTQIAPLLPHLQRLGWFVEVQCRAADFTALAGPLLAAEIPLVFDHLGYPEPKLGVKEPGFQDILRLGRQGRAVVKLSGAFRLSRQAWPHADLDPFVAELLDAFGPARCVWGSDWPFVSTTTPPRYADVIALLARWLPEAADRHTVLVDAPRACLGLSCWQSIP